MSSTPSLYAVVSVPHLQGGVPCDTDLRVIGSVDLTVTDVDTDLVTMWFVATDANNPADPLQVLPATETQANPFNTIPCQVFNWDWALSSSGKDDVVSDRGLQWGSVYVCCFFSV